MTSPADLLARDRAVAWHPFTQAATAPAPLPVVAAQGAWLHLADGRRLLDAISSWWTVLHGHAHPAITAAIARQAATLDHVLFAGCTHPPAVAVAERLVALAPPGLTRVFFSDDGSTAVEVALKMAFQAAANRAEPARRAFVAFEHGYHGDTVGAMSLGDPGDFSGPFRPLLLPVERVPTDDLAPLADVLARRGPEIAAVVIEPMVQGAGGMRFMTPDFLRGVADLTRRAGALLVADEVMTGFGRTGRCFAVEHAGVAPDLMCVAKSLTGGVLPLAATLATDAVYQAFLGPDTRRAFLHGHSFTANPIACAAALASLELLPAALVDAARIQAFYAARLPPLAAHPAVASVRWLGAIGVVQLAEDADYFGSDLGPRLRDALLARGVLARPLGPVLYTMPPLGITDAELAALYDAIEAALDDLPPPHASR